MNILTKGLAAAVAAGAALALALPASAGVTAIATGPFDLANNTGTITANQVFSGNQYFFTFTTTTPADVLSQMQASTSKGVAENVEFSLYKGAVGSGTLVGSVGPTVGPALDKVLAAGDYYLELDNVAVSGELLSGGIHLSAAPEPAAWSLMILGVAGIGASLRSNRRRQGFAAV